VLLVWACLVNINEMQNDVLCSHEGPVWQLAWAHPVYGSVLATCGYDKKVILWKEQESGWTKIYEYLNHDSSGMQYLICCNLRSERLSKYYIFAPILTCLDVTRVL